MDRKKKRDCKQTFGFSENFSSAAPSLLRHRRDLDLKNKIKKVLKNKNRGEGKRAKIKMFCFFFN